MYTVRAKETGDQWGRYKARSEAAGWAAHFADVHQETFELLVDDVIRGGGESFGRVRRPSRGRHPRAAFGWRGIQRVRRSDDGRTPAEIWEVLDLR